MLYQEIILRDLAVKYHKDPRIIERIVSSPFKFLKKIVTDGTNARPLRIRYLGVFVQKPSNNKNTRIARRAKVIEDNMVDAAVVMSTVLGFQINDVASARKIVEGALETKDTDKVDLIYFALKEYLKK